MEQINLRKIPWKNIFIGVMVLFVIIMITKCTNDKKVIESYTKEKRIDTLTIKKWRDKFNREHTLVNQNEINYANLINAKEGEIAVLRKDIAENKNIVGKTVIRTSATRKIAVKAVNDTIKKTTENEHGKKIEIVEIKKKFEFKDEFLNLEGTYFPVNDSVQVCYSTKGSIDIFQKVKSNGWFKKNTIQVEVVNNDPNSVTEKLQVFVVETKKTKKWFETRGFNMALGVLGTILVEQTIQQTNK